MVLGLILLLVIGMISGGLVFYLFHLLLRLEKKLDAKSALDAELGKKLDEMAASIKNDINRAMKNRENATFSDKRLEEMRIFLDGVLNESISGNPGPQKEKTR
jgi:hypothetical protein